MENHAQAELRLPVKLMLGANGYEFRFIFSLCQRPLSSPFIESPARHPANGKSRRESEVVDEPVLKYTGCLSFLFGVVYIAPRARHIRVF